MPLLGVIVTTLTVVVMPAGLAPPVVETVAGSGSPDYNGDGIAALDASLWAPNGVAVDASGNLYIADRDHHRVRRVDAATGLISTVAGTGVAGYGGDNGQATLARLSSPTSVALDGAGHLFIADRDNRRVRRVDAITGVITTVAGNGVRGSAGDGGPATAASLFLPFAVAVSATDDLFISDMRGNKVRRVDGATGVITTYAGIGGFSSFSGDGGPAENAGLGLPTGLALDASGNLFIADEDNYRVRRVEASSHQIMTVAGVDDPGYSGDGGPATSANLGHPFGVTIDTAGDLFIADSDNNRIRRVDAATQIITTFAGTGEPGFGGDGGPAGAAKLSSPIGVALGPSGALFIGDFGNNRVRRVAAPNQPPIAVAGTDRSVPCTSPDATQVTLDGSASVDPDGDALSYTWSGGFPESGGLATGAAPTVSLPLGPSIVSLVVNDGQAESQPDEVTITVTVGVDGLLPPLGPLEPEGTGPPKAPRSFNLGRTLPLRLRLGCDGTPLSDQDVLPPRIAWLTRRHAQVPLPGSRLSPSGGEAGGAEFRFSLEGSWIYNLRTRGLETGPYEVGVVMPDGRVYVSAFTLR